MHIKLLQVQNLKKSIDGCISEVNEFKKTMQENEAKFNDLNLKITL